MLQNYPDSSGLTFVVSTEREKGALQYLTHREVGGLLPAFRSFDEYKTMILSSELGLNPPARDEELVQLTLYLLEQGLKQGEDAALAASDMLPAMRMAAMFALGREDLKNLKGIRPEQIDKIDSLFDVMEEYDRFLEARGLFMPLLREERFRDHTPAENDIFVNLPLFTPANEAFFGKIPPDRKWVDAPAYADAFRKSRLDYSSSLHLLRRAGVSVDHGPNVRPAFHELQGKAALPAFLRKRIADFLREKPDGEQMFILLLDERLSFYLWRTVFQELGGLANFSLGLPLGVTSAGIRISRFLEEFPTGSETGDFQEFRADLAHELYRHYTHFAPEERFAMEAAVDFVGGIEKHCRPLGNAFHRTASILLEQRQFFLKGERTAPIQVVGLGEAAGVPFEQAIILPICDGVFPSKIYDGPFLNVVHTPRIHEAHFEMEELLLRRFMSFGKSVDLVSVFDEAHDMTPSFFFNFLKTEFGGELARHAVSPASGPPKRPAPFIENNDAVRDKILAHSFSFSSLGRLLTCPFCFYHTDIERMPLPDAMQEEENIHLSLGRFVHAFFDRLAEEPDPAQTWKALLQTMWEESEEIERIEGSAIFRLILFDHLEALSEHEPEDERLLLFGKWKRRHEKRLEAAFGPSRRFRLNGRPDAVVERDDGPVILDYKYSRQPQTGKKPLLEALENENGFDPRFQILLYAWLLSETEGIPPENLKGYFVYLKEDDPAKCFRELDPAELRAANETVDRIAERIEAVLASSRLEPNPKAETCRNCSLPALCRIDTYYRKSAKRGSR